MSNFTKRTIYGLLYAAIVVAAVLLSQEAAEVLFLVVAIMAIREFHKLVGSSPQLIIWAILAGTTLFMSNCATSAASIWRMISIFVLVLALIAELYREKENPIRNWGMLFCSIMMIALPFALMAKILSFADWKSMRLVLLSLFVTVWANDTGAYLVGTAIGKHKMFPRVSPAKTWEGLFGGIVLALITGVIFWYVDRFFTLGQWLAIALTASIAGTFGDLLESLFKRTLGVKDSGNFLPGHGGVLDRFDSLLLATPAVWILLEIFQLCCPEQFL